jgi:hypothetical protein
MQIKFIGFGNRIMYKKDWASVDIEHDTVVWSDENEFTADVGEEAAQWLLENDPEFKAVPKKDTASEDKTAKK